MATKNFTEFDLRTAQTLNPNDFVVGYKSDGSTELRTTVRSLTGVLGLSTTGATGPTGASGPTGSAGATGYDFNYTPLTTNTNLQTNTGYIVNTTVNGALTGTLPLSPSVGHFVNFTVTTNGIPPFVINRNNSNINGAAENLVCDVNGNFTLIYTNSTTGWRFVPFSGITTTTLKTYKAVLSAGGNNQTGIPGVSGLQNIADGERMPFNFEIFNSDTQTFGGLQNPSSKSSVSVHIKQPGYYKIDTNLHLMDLQEGREIYTQIWQFREDVGNQHLTTITDTVIGTNTTTVGFIPGSTVLYLPNPNTYIYIVLSHNIPNPGPYVSLVDSRTGSVGKGLSEIIITKIG